MGLNAQVKSKKSEVNIQNFRDDCLYLVVVLVYQLCQGDFMIGINLCRYFINAH